MLSGPTLDELLDYTGWERREWLKWMRRQDARILEIGAGPGGDGRFECAGDLVRHIFSAEKRYVERLTDRPLTDMSAIPAGDVESLFQFGEQSRGELKDYISALPTEKADVAQEFRILNKPLTASPRKIVTHVLVHEIRHWAQIATLFRLNGLKVDFHDFLFSPVMSDGA